MDLLPLDSPRWSRLRHAYGYATDTPDLIRWLEREDRSGEWRARDGDAWFEVHSSICHQGTIYPATFAAFPHIVALALRGRNTTLAHTIVLAGIILRDDDQHGRTPRGLRKPFDEAMQLLREAAVERLKSIRRICHALEQVVWPVAALFDPVSPVLHQIDSQYHQGRWSVVVRCPTCGEESRPRLACSDDEVVVENGEAVTTHTPVYRSRQKPYTAAVKRGAALLEEGAPPWDNTQLLEVLAATASTLGLTTYAQHMLDLRLPLACPGCEVPRRIVDWDWR